MLLLVLLIGVLVSYTSGSLVEMEAARMDARLKEIEQRFDEVRGSGSLEIFVSVHAIETVLNPINRVRAKKFISNLTPATKLRLRNECISALNWEFLSDWTKIRAALEEEAEPFLVPVSERLKPLAAALPKTNVSPTSEMNLMDYSAEVLQDSKTEIIRILEPALRSGLAISRQAFAQVNEEIRFALEETANANAVALMLEQVEAQLTRTVYPVPEYLREDIVFVDEQIKRIESKIRSTKYL